jgi:type IV pilus assembly protein PilB
MGVSDSIERLTVERESSTIINKVAIEEGMRTLREDGLVKAAQGITSIDEIFRVVA